MNPARAKSRVRIGAMLLLGASVLTPVRAAAQDAAGDVEALQRKVAEQDARIAELERTVRGLAAANQAPATRGEAFAATYRAPVVASPASPAAAPPFPAQGVRPATEPSRLSVSGDLRLRQEFNWSDKDARDRSRTVMRARLGARYALDRNVTVGARLVTGDPDDPNTADVTVGDFVDDLTVSLDRAYVEARFGDLLLTGGKFALPLRGTELVWDGDFNPEGLGASVSAPLGSRGLKAEATALYSIVSEAAGGHGSDMLGGQVTLGGRLSPFWSASLTAGYYDYHLSALAGADAGDFRSNLRARDGSYLSDFDLLDVIAIARFDGFGVDWPVSATAETVHNFGAATGADTGYFAQLSAGSTAQAGGLRMSYGYMQAEADAVFAAFSHDNIGLATSYRLHQIALDYALRANTQLNLILYHYRPLASDPASPGAARDWLDRLRLNAVFAF
ncbi:hypothetical protein B2G71_14240 [Novosphingobium sp. PC22D]|uniref:putative porin n=1 Tax=Novosphingobium sp. PC22D TaxID=1962403 RepID=UPI000BFB0263|nr:putative porin [Novosphingobium sp. PC22D]PEQ11939.1 hypothetical protein B2G71_14240 [Novosphingobium sp. PC22D]